MSIKLMLVDDHRLFREGLRRILEMENDLSVVGEAGDGGEALTCLHGCNPDVVIMDINMPGINGVEATRYIKSKHPTVAVLVLTIHEDPEYLFEVLKVGASGYLLKDVEPSKLLDAIRQVASGKSVVHPGLTSKLITEFNRLSQPVEQQTQSILSDREQEVLHMMAKGLNNREIGEQLYISEKTVKNHVSSILRKLDVNDRTQAVVQGVKLKLVDIS